jgi:flavin reductase (DIM6/NTAB) family NADH-FMN oxidoreductase RutF
MRFDFQKLEPLQRYKLLSSTVTPRPIAWVTTVNEYGRPNAAPFSFFNIFGEDPPVLGFSVSDRALGSPKDTEVNIRRNSEFVVNLVGRDIMNEMNVTAIEFTQDVDELAEARLTPVASSHVKPPRIAESPVAFECRLFNIVELGALRSLILGEIMVMHISDDAVLDADRHYIDNAKLGLIGRMHANRYIDASSSFELQRISVEEWRFRKHDLRGAG